MRAPRSEKGRQSSSSPLQLSSDTAANTRQAPVLSLSASPEQDTADWQGHASNVRPRSVIRDMVEYGAPDTGDIAVKGEGDTHAVAQNDVLQGAIGNCYFMASLASLAQQQPDLLQNAISGPNADGSYDVTLYEGGSYEETPLTQRTINVSSSFVVESEGYTLGGQFQANENPGAHVYALGGDENANGPEMWVRLIEKAYAVMAGSWEAIDGGWEVRAYEALTGQQYQEFNYNGTFNHIRENGTELNPMSDEELIETVLAGLRAGSGIGCETYDNHTEARKLFPDGEFPFATLHAYAITDASQSNVTVLDPQMRGGIYGDGYFTITWPQFRALFKTFTTRIPA